MNPAISIRNDADFLVHEAADDKEMAFSLTDLLTHQANKNPAGLFLSSGEDAALTFSFAQAHDAMSRMSAFFRALKLPAGSSIGLLLSHHGNVAIAALACLDAGLHPLFLPCGRPFSELSILVSTQKCAALIGDRSIFFDMPEIAARLAAAHDCVRFVAGFGAPMANGVISIDTALRTLPASPTIIEPGQLVSFVKPDNGIATLSIDAMIAMATEHAAEAGFDEPVRLICTLPAHGAPTFCCGILTALLTGAELHSLPAPDSTALTNALLSQRAVHLIWPGTLEDMLDDVPHAAMPSATIVHHAPWEKHHHRGLQTNDAVAIVDCWRFSNQILAFAARRSCTSPAFPPVQMRKPVVDQTDALILFQDKTEALFAAGRCVQVRAANLQDWISLDCRAFRDHRGNVVAIEALPDAPSSKPRENA